MFGIDTVTERSPMDDVKHWEREMRAAQKAFNDGPTYYGGVVLQVCQRKYQEAVKRMRMGFMIVTGEKEDGKVVRLLKSVDTGVQRDEDLPAGPDPKPNPPD